MFPAGTLAVMVLLSLLGATLTSAAGVLISLRSGTVRQAQQTLSIALLLVFLLLGFGLRFVPPEARRVFMQFVTAGNSLSIELVAVAALAATDLALILAAMARFRRTQLILD